MGARCVGHGRHVPPPPRSRFCEANVQSLSLTIGAPPPDLYCALPVLLMCPPSFQSHRAPMLPAERVAPLTRRGSRTRRGRRAVAARRQRRGGRERRALRPYSQLTSAHFSNSFRICPFRRSALANTYPARRENYRKYCTYKSEQQSLTFDTYGNSHEAGRNVLFSSAGVRSHVLSESLFRTAVRTPHVLRTVQST